MQLATLVVGLAKNPTVVTLDLSHNMITDVGCEHLAKLLDAKNCVVLFLNLCNNRIKKIGKLNFDTFFLQILKFQPWNF